MATSWADHRWQAHAGTGLAFSHTGTNSGTPWADSVYQLLTARSADEAEEALREWIEPVNNVVYADVHGAYGYRYRGRIPLRPLANGWCLSLAGLASTNGPGRSRSRPCHRREIRRLVMR